ncbi:hypothetical protein PAXINDRAFT_177738 [Paxillus involutus ATCC 200175]|uniref:WD40 repeat-like protein n=1 Tax=Paxillus involutus ATCC 200175 TaxID=664439 RepID=A0A0C9T5Z4_PAXIN|nr:hypothetical protein PAXINDRAFT_177738 [Paxillus involutus ATCC 200175]
MLRGDGSHVGRGLHEDDANLPGVDSDSSRRKQMLLDMINILSELNNDNVTSAPTRQDLRISNDEKLMDAGADIFFRFERRVANLDKELNSFANAVRLLGSSVGVLSSAFKLREHLTTILFLFRENAANLFPRKIPRQSREPLLNPNLMDRGRRTNWRGHHPTPVAEHVLATGLEPDTLPNQFESFARDVVTFLDCLNEFPEFSDDAVNQSMRGFEADLKYWASCLADYKTQFRSPAVQRYVHDLTPEIGGHIDNITGTLSMFIEIGVPTIRLHQQNAVSKILNLSTVATFFSAVTATTLQYSYSATGDVLSDFVNAFWFSSLVLSIAAAVNSLLRLTWKQDMRSPGHRAPWWVLRWIKLSPLIFLVMSIAFFSSGLILFTYSSGQGPVTRTMITVLTAFTSFGLVAVSVCFASERWVFVSEVIDRICSLVRAIWIALHWCRTQLAVAQGYLRPLTNWVATAGTPTELLPYTQAQPQPRSRPTASTQPHTCPQDTTSTSPRHHAALSVCSVATLHSVSSEGRSDENTESRHSDARQRSVDAIRSVIMLQSTTRPMSPRRDSSFDTPLAVDRSGMSPGRFSDPGMSALRGARVTNAIEKLKTLGTLQEMYPHQALVRHLQFSPNGRYLATSSWDRTSVIFRVGESFTTHRTLVHVRGFIGQVAWSPNGRILLTRLTRAVKVWSEDGVCKQTIERPVPVQSIVWLPDGEGFLSVEGSDVVKLDLLGRVLATYHLGQVRLTNIAVTPDCSRLVGVGPSIAMASGPQPSRHTRVEKRIIVYNMLTKTKESQIPFVNDVRDITIARRSPVVLISPEKAAPQLWKLEFVRDRDRSDYAHTSRLSLKHTFGLKFPVDIVGPCQFGGKDDQFVLCAAKTGDIHIWDRETAAPLHCIRPQNTPGVGDLTCIGWNYATDDPMMFATGSHDGKVRIYSTPPEDSESDNTPHAERRFSGYFVYWY